MALDTRHRAFLIRLGRPPVYLAQQKSHAAETPETSTSTDIRWNARGDLTLQVSPTVSKAPNYEICGYSSKTIWPPTNGPTPRSRTVLSDHVGLTVHCALFLGA